MLLLFMIVKSFFEFFQQQSFLLCFNPTHLRMWGVTGNLANVNASKCLNYSVMSTDIPREEEPKFIVFYTRLLAPFSLICFKCKGQRPKVYMQKNRTMVTVTQCCESCGLNAFVRRSQPLVLGRYPAGYILPSFAILIAGASVRKVLKDLGIRIFSDEHTLYTRASSYFWLFWLTGNDTKPPLWMSLRERERSFGVVMENLISWDTLQNMAHILCSAVQLLTLYILNLPRYVINLQLM